jgi:hypothetical protein
VQKYAQKPPSKICSVSRALEGTESKNIIKLSGSAVTLPKRSR